MLSETPRKILEIFRTHVSRGHAASSVPSYPLGIYDGTNSYDVDVGGRWREGGVG